MALRLIPADSDTPVRRGESVPIDNDFCALG